MLNSMNHEDLVQLTHKRFGDEFEAKLVKAVGSELFGTNHAETMVRRAAFYFGQFTICGRCGGTGVLNCFRYVERGVCFKCNGAGGTSAYNFNSTYKILSEVSEERFLKRTTSMGKAWVKTQEKSLAKQKAWIDARHVRQESALAAVPEETAKSFKEYLQMYNGHLDNTYDKDGRFIGDDRPTVFTGFVVQILENYRLHGWGSPKQITACVDSLNRHFKKIEVAKTGQKFIEGEFQRFIGKVNSMTEEKVEVTSWITNYVTKIVLKGEHEEIVIIKTGSQKVIEQFKKHKDEGTQVIIQGAVKWVNPSSDVNMAVFTSKGMKIDK